MIGEVYIQNIKPNVGCMGFELFVFLSFFCCRFYCRKLGSSRSLSLTDILKVVLLFWNLVASSEFQSLGRE
jgi:hypothetical protein